MLLAFRRGSKNKRKKPPAPAAITASATTGQTQTGVPPEGAFFTVKASVRVATHCGVVTRLSLLCQAEVAFTILFCIGVFTITF